MALEAVIFQQELSNYNNNKDLFNWLDSNWSNEIFDQLLEEKNSPTESNFYLHGEQHSSINVPLQQHQVSDIIIRNIVDDKCDDSHQQRHLLVDESASQKRPRRTKSRKNKEEVENQRMTHIAVERNRRKQMNEYLSVLRSLMPPSYVLRGDQASIIGGAINFVKELEHQLHLRAHNKQSSSTPESSSSTPFNEFFTFPQYSTTSSENAVADIEVTMVESHACLKIRSEKRPKQLLKMVSGLQCLRVNILHLNVTTVDRFVMYSLSVKVEDDCKLNSVDDIATAVHQLLCKIREDHVQS
ncbi:hypothetical protein ACFE04_028145 [Oxalis oulophora]